MAAPSETAAIAYIIIRTGIRPDDGLFPFIKLIA